MADLVVTSAQVGVLFPAKAQIFDHILAETATPGQAVYSTTAGKVGLADANAAGKEQFQGITLTGGGVGQASSILWEGHVYGYDLSGLSVGALVYLSDTPGALADAASATKTVQVGRVVCLPDASATKVLYIRADLIRNW